MVKKWKGVMWLPPYTNVANIPHDIGGNSIGLKLYAHQDKTLRIDDEGICRYDDMKPVKVTLEFEDVACPKSSFRRYPTFDRATGQWVQVR